MDEFIELYRTPNGALDGLVVVLISGAPSDLSYDSYAMDIQWMKTVFSCWEVPLFRALIYACRCDTERSGCGSYLCR